MLLDGMRGIRFCRYLHGSEARQYLVHMGAEVISRRENHRYPIAGPVAWRERFRSFHAHVTVAESIERDENEIRLGSPSNYAVSMIEPLTKSSIFQAHL